MTSLVFWPFLTYLPTFSYSITFNFGGYLGPLYLPYYRSLLNRHWPWGLKACQKVQMLHTKDHSNKAWHLWTWFVFVYINSWNAATIFIERFPIWLWCCGHMKQAVPCTRQVLGDHYVIFNFEFITPIRDGPDMVTFCQGYIAIDGEDVFWKGFSWSVD